MATAFRSTLFFEKEGASSAPLPPPTKNSADVEKEKNATAGARWCVSGKEKKKPYLWVYFVGVVPFNIDAGIEKRCGGVRLIDFSRGPRRSCNAGRKIWQERWFGNYGIEIMHQKYGITVCDAFISFVCGEGGKKGNAKYRVSNKSCKNQQRWFQWDSRNRSRLDRYTYMHCGGNHARLTGRK